MTKPITSWEHYAHAAADAKLRDQPLPDLRGLFAGDPADYEFAEVERDFLLGFEGWSTSEAKRALMPYQAGELARLIYDDRSTFVTQILEWTMRRGRKWFRLADVVGGPGSADSYQNRVYLRTLVNDGYLLQSEHPMKGRPRDVIWYRYLRAKERT